MSNTTGSLSRLDPSNVLTGEGHYFESPEGRGPSSKFLTFLAFITTLLKHSALLANRVILLRLQLPL